MSLPVVLVEIQTVSFCVCHIVQSSCIGISGDHGIGIAVVVEVAKEHGTAIRRNQTALGVLSKRAAALVQEEFRDTRPRVALLRLEKHVGPAVHVHVRHGDAMQRVAGVPASAVLAQLRPAGKAAHLRGHVHQTVLPAVVVNHPQGRASHIGMHGRPSRVGGIEEQEVRHAVLVIVQHAAAQSAVEHGEVVVGRGNGSVGQGVPGRSGACAVVVAEIAAVGPCPVTGPVFQARIPQIAFTAEIHVRQSVAVEIGQQGNAVLAFHAHLLRVVALVVPLERHRRRRFRSVVARAVDVLEVMLNQRVHQLVAPCGIAVALGYAGVVHQHDAGGTRHVAFVLQVVDDGGVGMRRVVAVAVAQ